MRWSKEESEALVRLSAQFPNKWTTISKHMHRRSAENCRKKLKNLNGVCKNNTTPVRNDHAEEDHSDSLEMFLKMHYKAKLKSYMSVIGETEIKIVNSDLSNRTPGNAQATPNVTKLKMLELKHKQAEEAFRELKKVIKTRKNECCVR